MPDRMPEDMPDRMPEDLPNRMPDRMPEDMSDRMPEDMSEYMPEDMPDRMPDCMPEDMSDRMPEDMPDRMPEDLPDRMPEDMPEDMPDHMPEDMPDRMPNRMSEDMSDRMPEDLPVRKCINVMVGITRSKVIFSPLGKASILWGEWDFMWDVVESALERPPNPSIAKVHISALKSCLRNKYGFQTCRSSIFFSKSWLFHCFCWREQVFSPSFFSHPLVN